jgi:GTP-binding protein HflX
VKKKLKQIDVLLTIKLPNLKQDLVLDKQEANTKKNTWRTHSCGVSWIHNVGKSTIMNLMSKSDVLAENKLFATLDTTVRKVVIENIAFLLSDTVGFIRKLPHHLIESFKSTLDETKESDIIVHVVDASHENFRDHINVVNETFNRFKCYKQPRLVVFNKMDLYREKHFDKFLPEEIKKRIISEEFEKNMRAWMNCNCVFISASNKENIDEFRNTIILMVQDMYHKRYPYKSNFYG